jgi:hypothetical protein
MTNKEAHKILTEHTRNYIPLYDAEALEVAIKALKNTSPCDLCVHNPPSSFGGKPCTGCPAEPKECDEK